MSRRKVRRRIIMKKSITFLSLSIMLVFGAVGSAQSKGQSSGHVPSVTQGHGQSGAQDHSKTTSSQQGAQSSSSKQKPNWETKFNERLQSDPAFQTRIKNLLPPNMDPATAASGFKNRGQF